LGFAFEAMIERQRIRQAEMIAIGYFCVLQDF
jgi:hypothetical protein